MGTKARVLLTVALGVVLGLSTWLGVHGLSPSGGVEEVVNSPAGVAVYLAFLILVPLIVGRWWVVCALVGRFAALAILQLTGHVVIDDGAADPLSLLSLIGLAVYGLFILALVGIRVVFDGWRARRLARPSVVSSA